MPKSRASVLFLFKRIKFFQRFYENLIKDLKIRGKKELHQMNIHHIIEISALRKEDGNECIRKSFMVFLRWFFSALGWFLAGILWSITIIGLPVGKQCFKFAALAAWPFGKEIVYGGGAGSLILNIIWMIITGIPMALESVILGALLCITIIGIPFGLQHFKMAKLALMPFGAQIIYT